jgi:hypothetical protein
MLVDEYDADVLTISRKGVERRFNGRVLGLAVHYQEVLLRIRSSSDVLARVSAGC